MIRFRQAIKLILICLLICTVGASLDGLIWPINLFVHFRVQYTFIALFCAIFLGFGQKREMAFGLFLAFVNFAHINQFMPTQQGKTSGLPSNFRVVEYNLDFNSSDALAVVEYFSQAKFDLVLFTEVNGFWKSKLEFLNVVYPAHDWRIGEGPGGLAILSRWPFKRIDTEFIDDIIVEIDFQGHPLTVVGTHPKCPISFQWEVERDTHLMGLAEYLSHLTTDFILIGDLNTTPWSNIFKTLLSISGAVDTRVGFGILPTWPSFLPPLRIPIDHILISKNIELVSRTVLPFLTSDHAPSSADLIIR